MSTRPDVPTLLAEIQQAGIACGPVADMREALTGPIAQERELLVEVDDRRGGTRPVIRPAARFSDSLHAVRGAAPRRGEHNREVLRDLLGLDEERLDQLYEAGVLLEGASDDS
jgi:crotonobetainyl-CoA:carnitine CoA-transferase CaiB-like acyl-CoA transferase